MSEKLKVLMYGWEFPPYISGGLGMACYAIVRELIQQGVDLSLVLPYTLDQEISSNDAPQNAFSVGTLPKAFNLFRVTTNSILKPYSSNDRVYSVESHETLQDFLTLLKTLHFPEKIKLLVGDLYLEQNRVRLLGKYAVNLLSEVFKYAALAGKLARKISHQIIYAHDWLTVLAAIEAKAHSGMPLVLHMHALEIDRSEGLGNEKIFAIEQYGLEQADHIIAVSQYTKDRIVKHYHISPDKISVVHNGVEFIPYVPRIKRQIPIISFVGRLTYQKGPYFFVEMARRILAKFPSVQFVLVGTGDLFCSMVEHAAALKLGINVHFTGFLNSEQVKEIYRLTSIYVMPSISEPFGLTALEAAAQGIPVVLSKQSGVKEVLKSALIADFWDVNDLVDKISSLLRYDQLTKNIVRNSWQDVQAASWTNSVNKIIQVYRERLR